MRDFEPGPDKGEEVRPLSKTKRKEAMLALQDIGEELVKLPANKLEKLDLPEELRRAVEDCRRFTRHGAIRRQLQYIGRLMRGVDEAPIARQLAAWRGESDEEKALQHRIERWRDRLIENDEALTLFLNDYPQADATRLRQLIRNARHEAAHDKPPKSSRAVFRLVREAVQAARVNGRDGESER
ncbi:MAG: ribosome biogenesis factor YjgA [Pseudomonadota bacterium]